MTKIIKTSLLAVSLTLITSNVLANNEIGKQTYEQTCAACHANGIAGAPKVGDLDLWADRLVMDVAVCQQKVAKPQYPMMQ